MLSLARLLPLAAAASLFGVAASPVAPYGQLDALYGQHARYARVTTSLEALTKAPTAKRASPCKLTPRDGCNTATDRQCWSTGFDIHTDYETATPDTGVTRRYTLTVTEADDWTGGDGGTKAKAMLVNGGFPGPTISADWGDFIEVTVVNALATNGTSIHWHGVRQLGTNNMDGTPGLTECPVAPGGSKTYRFRATQYGSSWYHSHFSSQYGNGVVGAIVIRGPASANYDVDLGPLTMSDWYYGATDQILARINDPTDPFIAGFPGSVPPSDNVLFNGLNVNPGDASLGRYLTLDVTAGQSHLLRLINPSVENSYTVSLVGHSMTIVAADFVPVEPVVVDHIYMGIGQRYDVIINATAAPGSYWLNVSMPTGPCGASNNPFPAAIVRYTSVNATNATTTTLPTDPGTAPPDAACADPGPAFFRPVVARSAPAATSFDPTGNQTLTTTLVTSRNNVSRVYWPVNNSPMNITWADPTLAYVRDGTVDQISAQNNVVAVDSRNAVSYWLLENDSAIPHPIHLHGHDIMVLGASPAIADPLSGAYSLRSYDAATDAASLHGDNPTRRDTAMLPAWGWLVVAFETNNPGAWLFHCHVAWHVSQGLSVQFLEQAAAVPSAVDLGGLADECTAWSAYYPANAPFKQEDSGL